VDSQERGSSHEAVGGDTRPHAGYWYADAVGERERARAVLELLRTYRVAETAMRRRTRESMAMGENDLLALRFLLRQPDHSSRPRELTEYLGLSSASITSMLDRLEASGHVSRVANPGDRRSIFIRATPHADEEVRQTLSAMHERMYAAAVGMTEAENLAVMGFLQRMCDAVDGVAPSEG